MVSSLEGVTTLYNTYWVRFAHKRTDHDLAVDNSRALFQAARFAGVERIVHVSVTHPSADSPFPYFRGKALVERALAETGVPYAVLRPAVLFGGDGVLLNNIAWLLRRVPVFAMGGRGAYRIRGIHVDDLAQLCLQKGNERINSVTDAVGPERPTFVELVTSIKTVVNSHSRLIQVPGFTVPLLSRVVGTAWETYCLRAMSTAPWPLDWSTLMAPPQERLLCRSGWPAMDQPSGSTTPMR
jgi:NADH dehydrogenase